MKVDVTSSVEVDLRTTPYAEWPQRAKELARIAVDREMRKARGQADLLFRERIIAVVEEMAKQEPFEL